MIPDDFQAAEAVYAKLGDFDADGVVGVIDLFALFADWGPCGNPCPQACLGDLDGDCTVGVTDLFILFANWG